MADRGLVVGGGIMGLCVAWALARAGWDVAVLDQDSVPNPRGSSVDQHRLIRHAYGAQAGYMRMVDAAYDAWDRVWRDLGEVLHVQTGVLALAAGPGWMDETRAALAADGRDFADLTPEQIGARYPFLDPAGLTGGLYMESGGVLLAERIVTGLARWLGERVRRARVLEVDPARAALRTEAGWESADLLIVAAGPWAPRLVPGLAERVTPSRQVLLYLEPPARFAESWARAPMLLDLSGGFYAVPPVAGTGLKLGDHSFSLTGDPEGDRIATEAEIALCLAGLNARLVDAGAYRLREAKVCFYDVTPDEAFVIEPIGPAAWVMSGFSGHGFKFGAVLGLELARTVGGERTVEDLRAWAAGRDAVPA